MEEVAGIAPAQLERIVDAIAGGRAVSFWWTMGVNQSHQGVRTAQALINLALLTGNIGRPGTGANSITGQCNAMGSRLFSNTTSLLGGYDFAVEEHRQHVAGLLGIDEALVPTEPSWSYDRIVEGINRGEIRGLWMIATNGAHSWINQTDLHDLIARLDFFVVQDLYTTTESAQLADLVLPAAGWAEKEGTFINSERRLGIVKRVVPAPGEALADFSIFKAIAAAWGCGEMFEDWTDPEATFGILQRLTAGRPCDLTGVQGYAHVDEGDVQWPYPAAPDGGAGRRRPAWTSTVTPSPPIRRSAACSPRAVPHPRRAGPVPVRGGDAAARAAEAPSPARAAHRPRLGQPVAHRDPHREVGHAPGPGPRRPLAGDAPRRCRRASLRTGDDVRVSSPRGSLDCRVLVVPTVPTGRCSCRCTTSG